MTSRIDLLIVIALSYNFRLVSVKNVNYSYFRDSSYRYSSNTSLEDLPDFVIVKILNFIDLTDLIITANRVCKRFYYLIKNSSILWREIDFHHPVSISNKDQLHYLLNHARKFQTFLLGFHSLDIELADIDFAFVEKISKAVSLHWLDISGCKISTLCYLKNLTNLKIVNLSECKNLVDDDFQVLKHCIKLDQLHVSFTNITANTVIEISSRVLKLSVLDVCGIELSIQNCEQILQNNYHTLLAFMGNEIDDLSVCERLQKVFIDISIHVHRPRY